MQSETNSESRNAICKLKAEGVSELPETQAAFVGGYISKKLKRRLERIAEREERPVTWILEKMLDAGVKSWGRSSEDKGTE